MAAGPAGEQNLQILAHSQSMSNHTQTHIIGEFEQHLSLASTQGQEAPIYAYHPKWISKRMYRIINSDLVSLEFDTYIVAKETWCVPTVLTSSQNQFKWMLIKTTVNEQNHRLIFDEELWIEALGTFKTRSLIVYIAEAEGLREILRNNVLPITDDILAILRHKRT